MITNPTLDEALRFVLKTDLSSFVRKVFHTVSTADAYRHNWHIDAITYELMRVHSGETHRLIITQPPRSLKSICTSVAFPAWVLGHNPGLRFACVSYSNDLAVHFARQFRRVVQSQWYRALFGGMRLARDTETECETTKAGGRIAISIGGTFTGRGADIIIIDDPLKADEAQSEKSRVGVNEWYGSTLVSRLNDKAQGGIILVMQRLHEDDLAGHLLTQGAWRRLDLPAIAVADQLVPTGPHSYHNRKEGDILHPERESKEQLNAIKRDMGSLLFSAQYQQRPVPIEGNLIRRDWLKFYDRAPEAKTGRRIVQSWDVATSISSHNDWSVCTTWLVDRKTYYLIDLWRGRLEFPDVCRKAAGLARAHSAGVILVERDGPGGSLVQLLRDRAQPCVPTPISIKASGSKVDRLTGQSARFEAGQIILPRRAPWLDTLLHELLAFPNARYDDQVDSISQFLIWAERGHFYDSIPVGAEVIMPDPW